MTLDDSILRRLDQLRTDATDDTIRRLRIVHSREPSWLPALEAAANEGVLQLSTKEADLAAAFRKWLGNEPLDPPARLDPDPSDGS